MPHGCCSLHRAALSELASAWLSLWTEPVENLCPDTHGGLSKEGAGRRQNTAETRAGTRTWSLTSGFWLRLGGCNVACPPVLQSVGPGGAHRGEHAKICISSSHISPAASSSPSGPSHPKKAAFG